MRSVSNITFVNDAAEATVVTCEGAFHGEVMAIAILSCLGKVHIMRTNNPQDVMKASEHGAIICAVGDKNDADSVFGYVDQKREDGLGYSFTGLMWKEHGREVCSRLGCLTGYEAEAAEIVDQILIRGIDAAEAEERMFSHRKPATKSWGPYEVLISNNRTYRELNAPDPYAPNAQVEEDDIFLEACELACHMLWRAVEQACSIVFQEARAARGN